MKYFSKFVTVILVFFSTTISAQSTAESKNNSFANSLRFGGGISLSFGNDFFSGSLSPFVLHEVNEYLYTGVGLNLTYSNFDDNESLIYGGSLVVIGEPVMDLQLSMEFEQLSVNRTIETIDGTIEDNYWYPALFLGLGYVNGPVTFGVRYDVLYNEDKSIYADALMPFVRVMF